ncbi:SIS domain-containing protein [Virgibacillus halotolerans]|uniref:SIS domain-containing protein n=1 Tax=Virgibacillus halotolerans TaxID=1071053 RepID=UPI00195F35DE
MNVAPGKENERMNFENRIQKFNSLLTENDRKIIKYLLANKDTILNKTIVDLSEAIHVSPASITRFCKKVDFNSFQEMKFHLGGRPTELNKADDTLDTIYNYYQSIIKSTQQFISEEQTTRIVSLILNAKKVVFCGIGNSGLIANEFNSRIERMGINSNSITDTHAMLMKTSLLGESDLLICFSNTGKTKSVIDSAKLAQENHVPTVVVTNYDDTLLTKFANEVVLISSYKYIDDEKFVNSQLPGLFFLDLLIYKLLSNDKLMINYQKTLKAINEHS